MDYEVLSEYNEEYSRWEVKVSGEIDIFNSNDFKDRMAALLREKRANLRIDCGGLRYIDSTALGALVSILKAVQAYDGVMTLTNTSANMQRLLKITNLDKTFLRAD